MTRATTTTLLDRRRRAGFSLLELVIAMGVLSLLVGMVFMTARSSLALGAEVVRKQNEEMLKSAFFEMINRQFASLPGNTILNLESQDSGSHYLSEMTLQNVPLAFTWGGSEQVAKAVRISTVRRRDGFLSIVLRFYQDEVLSATGGDAVAAPLIQPFAEIVLLDDVRLFEWRALDGRSMEWAYDWDIRGRLPLQLELVVAFGQDGEAMRQIFWLPPIQNPEVVMRQLMQGSGQSSGGSSGTGGISVDAGRVGGGGGSPGEGGRGGNPGAGGPRINIKPGGGQ